MASDSTAPVLVPILGDQLTRDLASLRGCAKDDTVVLMTELDEETRYVGHHKQKLVFILSAMRHFAQELSAAGWREGPSELRGGRVSLWFSKLQADTASARRQSIGLMFSPCRLALRIGSGCAAWRARPTTRWLCKKLWRRAEPRWRFLRPRSRR